MSKFIKIFQPMIDQYAWSVKLGHGSWFSVEFGKSHLHVRNPIRTDSEFDKVKHSLSRRIVSPRGQFSLLVMGSYWELTTKDDNCNSEDDRDDLERMLKSVDGQILQRVLEGEDNSLELVLDLNTRIKVAFNHNDPEDSWQLHNYDEGVTYSFDGAAIVEHDCVKSLPGSIEILNPLNVGSANN